MSNSLIPSWAFAKSASPPPPEPLASGRIPPSIEQLVSQERDNRDRQLMTMINQQQHLMTQVLEGQQMQQGQIHHLLQLQMQQFQAMTHFVMGSSSRPTNVQIDPRSNRSLPAWALDTSMALETAGDRRDQRSITHDRQSRSPLRRSVRPTHSSLRRHRDSSGDHDRSRRHERPKSKQDKSDRTVETFHNTTQKDRVASVPKQTQFPLNKLDPSKSRQPVLSLSLNAQDLEPRPKSDASSLMGRHTMEWFGQTLWYEVKPPLLQSDLQLGMTTTIGRANLSTYEVFEVPHPFIRRRLQGEKIAWVTPSIARFNSELLQKENRHIDGLCLYQQLLKVGPLVANDPQRIKNAFELDLLIEDPKTQSCKPNLLKYQQDARYFTQGDVLQDAELFQWYQQQTSQVQWDTLSQIQHALPFNRPMNFFFDLYCCVLRTDFSFASVKCSTKIEYQW